MHVRTARSHTTTPWPPDGSDARMNAAATSSRVLLPILGAGLALVIRSLVRTRRRCRSLEVDLAKALQLRQDERSGRTAAERRLRQLVSGGGGGNPGGAARAPDASTGAEATTAAATAGACSYRPIGYVESCFVERRGTPRQGMLAPDVRARLRLRANIVQPAAALDGLTGFSHVWLLYDFHENTNAGKPAERIKAKVHPPGMGGGRIGLFATRTPHRPNAIGLTCARLLAVEGDTLVLGGADLIHGTPVLDVKPYLRHDIQDGATVPSWCEKRGDASLIAEVAFSDDAAAQLEEAVRARRLRFYADAPTARRAIEQTLQLDIRSVHQGRGRAPPGPPHPASPGAPGATPDAADAPQAASGGGGGGQAYSCKFDELKIEFTTYEAHVLVTRCEAGVRGVDRSHYAR